MLRPFLSLFALTAAVLPLATTTARAQGNSLLVSASSLSFTHSAGGAVQAPQTVAVLASAGNVPFTVNVNTASGGAWLLATPVQGTTPANLSISINPTGLTAGSYSGQLTITSAGLPSVTVSVTLSVSNTAQFTVSPATLTFSGQAGGAALSPQVINIGSTGSPLFWNSGVSTVTGGNWLSVSAPNGLTPAALTVAVNTAGLAPGTYTGNVQLTSQGATNSPVNVPVTLTLSAAPTLLASPSQLVFNFQTGGAAPPAQPVAMSSIGGALTYSTAATVTTPAGGTWLSVTPATGTTPSNISVAVNPAGLAPGIYNGSVTATPVGATAPVTIPVTLNISANPLLNIFPTTLLFSHQIGTTNPPNQTVNVGTTGPVLSYAVTFSTASGGNWLVVGSAGGATGPNSSIQVGVNPVGVNLPAGTYTGNIVISSTGAANSPVTVPVTLTVTAATLIGSSPSSLTFTATPSTPPAFQTLSITSSDPTPLTFTTTATTAAGGNWLVVGATGTTTPGTVNVSINPAVLATLPGGAYNGTVTIAAPGASNSPLQVPVTLNVNAPPALSASPTSLTFTQTVGAALAPSQAISLTSAATNLTYVASFTSNSGGAWLTISPASGLVPGTINAQLAASAAGLGVGTYTGQITVVAAGVAAPVTIPVTLNVTSQINVTVNPNTLAFSFTTGGANPAAQNVQVTATGGNGPFSAAATTAAGGNWLAVTPTSGTTPTNISVSVNPAGLQPGTYTGTVTVSGTGTASGTATIAVTFTISAVQPPNIATMVNAASFQPSPAVPGLIVSLVGTNLGPATGVGLQLDSQGNVTTTLAEVRVLFDGIPAPLLFVRADQINAVVPYGVFGRATARLQLEYRGVRSNAIDLQVQNANPAIFTVPSGGRGQGAIINQDNTINTIGNPAQRGSIIAIYATGEGQTNPPGQDGRVIQTDLRRPQLPVSVRIGGVPAEVVYAGSAPQIVSGMLQVNVRIPENAPTGVGVPLDLTVGTAASPATVTVAVR